MNFNVEKLLTPVFDFRPLFTEGPNKHIKINRNGFVIGAKPTKNELTNYDPGTYLDRANGYKYLRYHQGFGKAIHKAMALIFPEFISHDNSYSDEIIYVIDHIDDCKQNNHVTNLRLIPQSLNRMNLQQNLVTETIYEGQNDFQRLTAISTPTNTILRNILPECFYRFNNNVLEIRLRINPTNNDWRCARKLLNQHRDGTYTFPKWIFYDNEQHQGVIN